MTDRTNSLHRRRMLQLAATGGVGLGLAAGRQSVLAQPAPAVSVAGGKFTADGRVARFAGNTVVCHLPQQGPGAACFEALMDGYRDAPIEPALRKIAMLPPSSYHMTVFGGANDSTRARGDWPSYVPLDASMSVCDGAVAEHVRRLKLDLSLPIRMKVDPHQGPLVGDALQVLLLPFDESEAAKLAATRQALAAAFSLRRPRDAPYRFHISLGYIVQPLTSAEARAAQDVVVRWARRITERAPSIPLSAPEFCTFDDMFHFRRQFDIG